MASQDDDNEVLTLIEETPEQANFFNTYTLLVYWSIMSTIAFTFAGERMPWLDFSHHTPTDHDHRLGARADCRENRLEKP